LIGKDDVYKGGKSLDLTFMLGVDDEVALAGLVFGVPLEEIKLCGVAVSVITHNVAEDERGLLMASVIPEQHQLLVQSSGHRQAPAGLPPPLSDWNVSPAVNVMLIPRDLAHRQM